MKNIQELTESHIEKRATHCIICDSRNVTFRKFHCGVLGDAHRAVQCNDCSWQWEQLFELFDICNLTKLEEI